MNPLRDSIASGRLVLGSYVTMPATTAVDALAGCGLDFIRLDPYRFPWDYATLRALVASTHAHGMSAWLRSRPDPWQIARLVDLGAAAISVPDVSDAAAARAVVDAVHVPPRGRREPSLPVHAEGDAGWSPDDVLVGCQIETKEGLANHRAIIATEGVNILHTGRNDIAAALGLPGEQFHPRVLDTERRVVEAVLEAGKQMALFYPATPQGIEYMQTWIAAGVRVFAVDTDYRVLHRVLSGASAQLRESAQPGGARR